MLRCNLPTPLLYAHRGAAVELPENTLPSFARALALGAGALEMDLHMTSDGVIVVSHDPDGRRLAGVARAIRDTPWAEVRGWDVGGDRHRGQGFHIPSLEEVLRGFPDVPVNVDVKQQRPAMVQALLELIARERAASRVLIASFHANTLAEVRRRGYRGVTALGTTEVLRLLGLPRLWLRNTRAGATPRSCRPRSGRWRWASSGWSTSVTPSACASTTGPSTTLARRAACWRWEPMGS